MKQVRLVMLITLIISLFFGILILATQESNSQELEYTDPVPTQEYKIGYCYGFNKSLTPLKAKGYRLIIGFGSHMFIGKYSHQEVSELGTLYAIYDHYYDGYVNINSQYCFMGEGNNLKVPIYENYHGENL